MTDCLAGPAHRDNDGRLRGGCLSHDPDGQPGTAERGPLCDADLTHAEAGIALLVHDYRDLEQLLPRPLGQRSDGQPGRGGEAPIPLRLDVEALQREIWWLTTAWAEVLADRHQLSDPPVRIRAGYAVEWAVRILRPRVEQLARIVNVQMASYPRPDEATTRFRTVTLTYVPGAQGVLDLSRAHQRARSILGLTSRVYSLPGYCRNRGCGRPALRQNEPREFKDEQPVWCDYCGASMTRDDYDRYGNLFLRVEAAA